MILKIELVDNQYIEIEADKMVYFTGTNRKMLWQIYRSIFYYFNKTPALSANIYGENNIELSVDELPVSKKNISFFSINNRESLYTQMTYKKDTLLFKALNQVSDDFEINRLIDNINDEQMRISLLIQKHLQSYSDSLTIDLRDVNYLELMKSQMFLGYEENSNEYPLEFMDTDDLVDEFLNLLKNHLMNATVPTWLVLSNLDSFIPRKAKREIMRAVKQFSHDYDLLVIYLGDTLNSIDLAADDMEKVVICAKEYHQLLPYDQLIKSVSMRYPNEFKYSPDDFIKSMMRVVPNAGSDQELFLNSKDLVLLKIVNELLNYETSYHFQDQLLTDAEANFLK
ncbi:CRISPR-associated protein Csn2-St [Companilactobacillus sp.]|jgi:hypothetical protein|uniref:CRISPR-associated protein Csn2-St n=1 Tax=Companilactobacillus sp. TaxID=2767905 RepID=UPI0025B963D1|nr:CRISPR-associated protein Csn2-St [Companilactobacillus sp.]MCH4010269.1 hypothetical protein [Companilactobacillus sp.]MCH4052055.1 hypothetical protein [Companilactobacillus sp.]MCH4078211.1 hypothetical protein [Companilactobacillus sp.]MCH4126787.1 hypothetical protein [Companilactobacillus sp.]MCH4132372.1 hypothetical protein [Companilactobacillus sp.]